jgi:hypothetical protein
MMPRRWLTPSAGASTPTGLDADRAPALRKAARAHAMEKLCARRMAEAVAKVYERVMGERR